MHPYRHEDVEQNAEGDAQDTGTQRKSTPQQHDTGEQKKIPHLISLPSKVLEFQGKHRNFAHQQTAENGDQKQQRKVNRHGLCRSEGEQVVGEIHRQTTPKQSIGRRGQPDERSGLPGV